MSLAARCSHCQTVFRITGPQLAAAQGWVRCGHCAQVFDAASNLVTPDGQPLDVPTVDAAINAVPPASRMAGSVTTAEFAAPAPEQSLPDIDLELPDLGPLQAQAQAASAAPTPATAAIPDDATVPPSFNTPAAPETPVDGREPFWTEPAAAPAVTADVPPLPDLRAVPPLPLQAMRESGASPGSSSSTASTTAPAPEENKPSRTASPRNWPGVLGAVVLFVSLLALSAYALRAHLAQAWPQARPLVIQACEVINCSLPPLRLIDAVEVQGSSLSLDAQTDLHRLRVSVRHRGDWPVQMPAFDLSLMDQDGKVLARRMIDPIEFENTQPVMQPGAESTLTLVMNLRAIEAPSIGSFKVSPYYP